MPGETVAEVANETSEVISVPAWHDTLARSTAVLPPIVIGLPSPRRFHDVDHRIAQPPLNQHVVAVHLGGAKRVIRWQGGRSVEVDVLENSFTIMPAKEGFGWETFGPIDFAHFPLADADLRGVALEEFDRDPREIALRPVIGANDPAVGALLPALLTRTTGPDGQRLHREMLSALLSFSLLSRFSDVAGRGGSRSSAHGKLATWQIRRVVDFMHDHLADDIELADLLALTKLGRARFFKAFRLSMGRSPAAYHLRLRLVHARRLLLETRRPITEVAAAVGLEPTRLSSTFRQAYGMSPRAFRAAEAGA